MWHTVARRLEGRSEKRYARGRSSARCQNNRDSGATQQMAYGKRTHGKVTHSKLAYSKMAQLPVHKQMQMK